MLGSLIIRHVNCLSWGYFYGTVGIYFKNFQANCKYYPMLHFFYSSFDCGSNVLSTVIFLSELGVAPVFRANAPDGEFRDPCASLESPFYWRRKKCAARLALVFMNFSKLNFVIFKFWNILIFVCYRDLHFIIIILC